MSAIRPLCGRSKSCKCFHPTRPESHTTSMWKIHDRSRDMLRYHPSSPPHPCHLHHFPTTSKTTQKPKKTDSQSLTTPRNKHKLDPLRQLIIPHRHPHKRIRSLIIPQMLQHLRNFSFTGTVQFQRIRSARNVFEDHPCRCGFVRTDVFIGGGDFGIAEEVVGGLRHCERFN